MTPGNYAWLNRNISQVIDRLPGCGFRATSHFRGTCARCCRLTSQAVHYRQTAKASQPVPECSSHRELTGCYWQRSSCCFVAGDQRSLNTTLSFVNFMQHVFAQIDAETLALRCCSSSRDNGRAVVRMMEIANYGFQRNAIGNAKSTQHITNLRLANFARQIPRHPRQWQHNLNSPVTKTDRHDLQCFRRRLERTVRLAFLYDEMPKCSTCTPTNARNSDKAAILVINDRAREKSRRAVGAERTSSHDHIRSTFSALWRPTFNKECLSIPATVLGHIIDFPGRRTRQGGGSVRSSVKHSRRISKERFATS